LKGRVIIYAPNIHTGGGIVLLKSIIKNWPADVTLHGYFDSRASETLEFMDNSKITWVNPTLTSRFKAEISLSKVGCSNDTVLFLNSLPPFFTQKGRTIVFMQNRNLIDSISFQDLKFKQALNIFIQRFLAYWMRFKVDEYIVQTDSLKRDLEKWFKFKDVAKNPLISVFPFMNSDNFPTSLKLTNPKIEFDFIYVADGLPHKNHSILFKAWEILANEDYFPLLAITISPSEKKLLKKVSMLQEQGIKILNLGWLSHHEVLLKYKSCRCLIFPSLRESFGLPLVEANKLDLPILASELDYVYDVCEPTVTFDPNSPRSVARAVKRFLNIKTSIKKMQDPKDFVRYICNFLN
tara:strand:- start:170 stop:1222 length:1053 start_codon:yes stop_codon:yes gene_type:complete